MADEPELSRLKSDIVARRGSCGRRRFFELNRTTGSGSVVTTRSSSRRNSAKPLGRDRKGEVDLSLTPVKKARANIT